MQYNNNDIDKNLRRLEDQAVPDLSLIDKHWDQLAQSAQPMPSIQSQQIIKWVSVAILASVIFIIAYQISLRSEGKKKLATQSLEITSDASDTTKPKASKRLYDTIGTSTLLTGRYDQVQEKYVFDTSKVPLLRPVGTNYNVVLVSHTSSFKDSVNKAIPVSMDSLLIKSSQRSNISNQQLLADFFRQLEKPDQKFIISAIRDTIIHGTEGSSFFIPANSFAVRGEVKITLKEFYTYADMVSNKLTTLSNNMLLESGGMIFIKAEMNNAEVKLQPGKIIRWFVPDTTQNMQSMRLFTEAESIPYAQGIDRVSSSSKGSIQNINWIKQEQSFQSNFNSRLNNVQNAAGTATGTSTSYQRIETFYFRFQNSTLSEQQISDSIKSYYAFDKFKINEIKDETGTSYQLVLSYLDQNRSFGKDSVFSFRSITKLFPQIVFLGGQSININTRSPFPSSFQNQFSVLDKKYGVDLSTMGWINCDRFYNDSRNKVNFTVELGESTEGFITFLVFDRSKTIMSGDNYGSRVIFRNVPEGEAVRVISVGIKNGQTVTAMESVTLSNTTLKSLQFETTTPVSFREAVKELDQQ